MSRILTREREIIGKGLLLFALGKVNIQSTIFFIMRGNVDKIILTSAGVTIINVVFCPFDICFPQACSGKRNKVASLASTLLSL